MTDLGNKMSTLLVMTILMLFPAIAVSQPVCSSINFVNAGTVNLKPSANSQIAVVRQADGSYTGYELASMAPYRVLNTVPHFEQLFGVFVSHPPDSSVLAPTPTVPVTAVSQPEAWAVLDSGNYLRVNAANITLFDGQLQLISSSPLGPVSTAPGSALGYTSIALADMNGDGRLDIIAAYVDGHAAIPFSGGVRVFLGQPEEGSFELTSSVSAGGGDFTYGSLAVGDLNNDGIPDVAFSSGGPNTRHIHRHGER